MALPLTRPLLFVWFLFATLQENVLGFATTYCRWIVPNPTKCFRRDMPVQAFSSDAASSSTTTASTCRLESIQAYMQLILQDKDTICTVESINARVQERHAQDCRLAQTLLAAESSSSASPTSRAVVDWEPLCTVTDNYTLAYRSKQRQQQPLLNANSRATLRQAAEQKWASGTSASRFTYQRPGNWEAHISDMGPAVRRIVDDLLIHQVYPMIRRYFWNQPDARLCVYDALYIRYNATEAKQQATNDDTMGAGQPLHRDLGIVSINVMLNEDFEGGGTFMENQLRDKSDAEPLKPVGAGHALAHYSSERHAGAATVAGVRDIMVIFVTAEAAAKTTPPALVQAAWLKQTRDVCVDHDNNPQRVLYCRLLHQYMAVQANPADGEAWQYLANTLIDHADYCHRSSLTEASIRDLMCAQQAIEEAESLIPCDARVYNTLGRILDRLSQQGQNPLLLEKVEEAYQIGIDLLERAQRMKCQVQELDSIRLNYGLHLANRDLFAQASVVLEPLAQKYQTSQEQGRICADAYSLYSMCERHK